MLERIQGLDSTGLAGGAAGGLIGLFVPDVFAYFAGLLVFANIWDWVLGRRLARLEKRYSSPTSRRGLQNKGDQLVSIGILRAIEWVLSQAAQIPETYGFFSVAVCLALLVDELESIEDNRMRLGGQPIPLLSKAIYHLRRLTGSERRRPDGHEPPEGTEDRRAGGGGRRAADG